MQCGLADLWTPLEISRRGERSRRRWHAVRWRAVMDQHMPQLFQMLQRVSAIDHSRPPVLPAARLCGSRTTDGRANDEKLPDVRMEWQRDRVT
jgi:hypothetical protein